MMTGRRLEQIALFPHLLKWLLLSALVGGLAGTASAWFLIALALATAARESHRWLVAFMPVVGFAVAWMYFKVGQAVEAGNNLLIDEVHDPRKIVPLRMAPLVFIGTVASHLVGASVGREGTAVQMGGALADQLTRVFRLGTSDRRLLLMSGISAGFASVFGTPLAGAVFGMEVLAIGRVRYDALLGCTTAAIVGDLVTGLWGVQHVQYSAGVLVPTSGWTLSAAVVAGVAFGLVGMAFATATHRLTAAVRRLVAYPPLRPVLGGIVIALALWLVDGWRYAGLGIPGIVDAFDHPLPWWDFAAKAGFTVASLGAGFKGGEVTPLFFIGATLGNALAPLLQLPFPMLAALGFVGVFAGAANTPLACTVMAMELFGAPIGVHAMIVCVVSYLFSGATGIYRAQRVGLPKHRFMGVGGPSRQARPDSPSAPD